MILRAVNDIVPFSLTSCGHPLTPASDEPRKSGAEEDKAAKKKAAARKLIEQRAAKKSPSSSPRSSPRGERKPDPELEKVLAGAKEKCSACGEENKPGAKACSSCGKPAKK